MPQKHSSPETLTKSQTRSKGWLRRNAFIVVGGFFAVVLIGSVAYFDITNYAEDQRVTGLLLAKIAELKALTERDPYPNNENILAAKREQRRCHAFLRDAGDYLTPTRATPTAPLDARAFKSLLENTIDELKQKANASRTSLPPDYSFTFRAARLLMHFNPSGLEPLASQLADIRALCTELFDAKVQAVLQIRRAAVSPDDPQGSLEFLPQSVRTNRTAGAIISPYAITFVGFTKELDEVLGALAKSKHGFVVRSLNVQSTSAAAAMEGVAKAQPAFGDHPMVPFGAPSTKPTPRPVTVTHATQSHGLPIVLQEKPLEITLCVESIRLLPSPKDSASKIAVQ